STGGCLSVGHRAADEFDSHGLFDDRPVDAARSDRDDLVHRLPGAPASCRAVGVEGLDLSAEDCSLLSGPGAPDDAQTHLGGVVYLDQAAECRSHADIFDEHRLSIDLIKLLETLEDDRRGQLCALLRAEAAVGDLSFSLPTGTIAERDLEFARTWCAGPAADVYAIISDLLKAHLREVRDNIEGDV